MKRFYIIPERFLVRSIKALLFSLMLVPMITSSSFYFPFIVPRNLFFRVIVELLFVVYSILVLHNRNFLPRKNTIWAPLLAFIGAMTLSSLVNNGFVFSFWSNFERMEGLVTYFHLLALIIVCVGTLRKKEDWEQIMQASLFSAFMVAFIGLGQITGTNLLLASSGGDRISSTLGNATYLAAFLMINIFIAVYFMLKRVQKSDLVVTRYFSMALLVVLLVVQYRYGTSMNTTGILEQIFSKPILALLFILGIGLTSASFLFKNAKELIVRAVSYSYYGILTLLFLFVMSQTQTRGALLGLVGALFIAGLLILFKKGGNRIARISGGILVTVLLLAGFLLYANRTSDFVTHTPILQKITSISLNDATTKTRYYNWMAGIKGFLEKPILGWGVENYGRVFNEHFPPQIYTDEGTPLWYDRPHNLLVQYLVEGGIIGLGAYLTLVGMLIVLLIRRQEVESRGIILSCLLLAYLGQNLFVFDSINSYIIIYILIGFMMYLIGEKNEPEPKSPRPVSLMFGWITTGIVIVVAFFAIHVSIAAPMNSNLEYVRLYRLQGDAYKAEVTRQIFALLDQAPFLGRPELISTYSEFAVGAIHDNKVSQDVLKVLVQGLVDRFDRARTDGYNADARFNMYEMNLVLNAGVLDRAYYEKTLSLADATQPLSPDRPQLYYIRGRAYMNLLRFDEGLADFKKAVSLAPKVPDALSNLFAAYATMGDGENAQKELDVLRTLVTFDTTLYARYTSIYVASGLYDEAVKLLERAKIDLPANANEFQVGIAEVYAAGGKNKEARAAMEEAVKLDPTIASYATDFYKRLDAGLLTRKK